MRGFLVRVTVLRTFLLLTFVRDSFGQDWTSQCGENPSYGAVMDAGSSGTRIYVYCWPNHDKAYQVPQIQEIFNKKVQPGLSAFLYRTHEIRAYLLDLIRSSLPYVPDKYQAATPVYLMATSGMRLTGEDNVTAIIEKVREIMRDKTAVPYRFEDSQARVLSGEEEGLFSWLAVNYLLGNFDRDDIDDDAFSGVLEMGGGSAQVAFHPDAPTFAHKFSFLLGGRLRSIYVHSYLGYGQDEMMKTYQTRLVGEAGENVNVDDPCRLQGDDDVFAYNGTTYNLVGTGDPQTCHEMISGILFNPVYRQRCLPRPCSIGNTYQPSFNADHTFYTVSAFKYTLSTLNVLYEGKDTFSPQELREKAFEFCQKPLQQSYGGFQYCAYGVYFSIFLERLGFSSNKGTLKSDLFQINGQDVEWPLGALIYHMSQVPIDTDDEGPPPASISGSNSPLCVLATIGAAVLGGLLGSI